MNLNLIDLFDKASDSAEFIPKLRQLILDLAVRGKLVPQNSKDEPASELLKKIKAEKDKLVKEGKIRKEKTLSPITPDEIPFEIPRSWHWTFLGDISQYGISEKVDSNKDLSPETWVLDLEDIEKNTSRLIERVLSSSRPFQSSKTKFMRGDVLFGKLRPYLNKVLVADKDGVCTTEIVPVRGFCKINPEYIRLVFKSPLTMKRVDQLMYGMKMPRLGTSDAVALKFPLPPLSEQKRIVAKVDELMSLCDELEAVHESRDEKRRRLNLASLKAVTDARTPEDFRNASSFFINHLTEITVTQDHIKNLRQTILDLAVRGKLVPQNPKDEPASELIKQIRMEKKNLIDEGKSRNKSIYYGMTEYESPFSIPNKWKWVLFEDIAYILSGYSFDSAYFIKTDGAKVIKITNAGVGEFIETDDRLPKSFATLHRNFAIFEGDLILALTRPYISTGLKVSICPNSYDGALLNQRVAAIRTSGLINKGYAYLFLRTPFVLNLYKKRFEGQGLQPNLKISDVAKLQFPLPPLPEQKRIVTKVDELMSLCDALEEQISITSTQSTRLLNALMQDNY